MTHNPSCTLIQETERKLQEAREVDEFLRSPTTVCIDGKPLSANNGPMVRHFETQLRQLKEQEEARALAAKTQPRR